LKIIFWNIKFLGSTKLWYLTNPVAQAAGLGNDFEDYIVKVVTGDAVWAAATTQVPADIFVIIELKAGGQKGQLGTRACLTVLNSLVPAMNAAAPACNYTHVPPYNVGTKETVGVIYNQHTLGFVQSEVMRDTNGDYLNKRSPFRAEFTVTATGAALNVVGIHGPTSQPTSGDYRDAIEYANQLDTIAGINQSAINPKQDLCIGVDFNCCPRDYYWKNAGNKKRQKVIPFEGLIANFGYSVTLPTPTDTSLLDSLNGANYLSQPYDNIVFQLPSQAPVLPTVRRIDTVAHAPTWGTNPLSTFNVARAVSDHLPVCIQY
jgi:endonuclease/exonuclease/phosphatase family metal-dependent hydrolase